MRYVIIYICIFNSYVLSSQDFSKDMNRVYETYKSNSDIGFNIKYVLHESHNDKSRVISSKNGLYVKAKNKTISKYDHLTTLTSADKIIVIDNEEKYIKIKSLNKNVFSNFPDFVGQFKNYEKSIIKTQLLKSTDPNSIMYSVELKSGGIVPISKYEISIDKKNSYITKVTMFYINKLDKDDDYGITGTEIPRLDIFFSDFNDKKIININELNESYYYAKSKGKLVASPVYKNYVIKENI